MTGEAHPECAPSQAPGSNAPAVGWGVGQNKYLQRLLGASLPCGASWLWCSLASSGAIFEQGWSGRLPRLEATDSTAEPHFPSSSRPTQGDQGTGKRHLSPQAERLPVRSSWPCRPG